MQKRTTSKSTQGFSLVEALIAAAILGAGVLAAAVMIPRSTIQDSRAYHLTQAALLAEEYIERHIPTQYDRNAFNALATNATNQTINGVTYLMDCRVNESGDNARCKEMNCTVTWNNKGLEAQIENIYVYCPKY